jgi:DNA-binding Lrp family transcriptional regulator
MTENMIEILKLLEKNGKLGASEIAEMLGEEEQEIASKITKLEEEKIIRRYKAVVDWDKAGVEQVYALIDIKATLDRSTGYDSIAERISRFPEVASVRLVSGNYDLSLVVRGSSMKEVAYFVAEKIATLDQVRDTVTHFSLRMYKEDGEILYEEEKNKRLAVTP